MNTRIVSVFGSSHPKPGSPAYQVAYDLGRAITDAGWTVCNGGYGGTMEAAACGAAEHGGHVIGVTCSTLRWRGGPNPFVRQEVPTFDLLTRLNTLVRLGDAFVVLPGGTGTLLELACVWELLNKGILRGMRPVVLLGDDWLPVVEIITRAEPDAYELARAGTVAEVISLIRSAWQRAEMQVPSSSPGLDRLEQPDGIASPPG